MSSRLKTKKSPEQASDPFRLLIESSPVALGICQNDTIVFSNAALKNILRQDNPDQIDGQLFADFLHPDDRDRVLMSFREALEQVDAVEPIESKLYHPDNAYIDVEITASQCLFNGKPSVQFALHENSKRKKMEEVIFQAKQDWEETFHTITDMVTIHDRDFNIVYANKAAEKILNLPAVANTPGVKCFRHYHGTAAPPEGCPSCNCLKTGKPANFEIFEPHLNMYVEIRSMPRFDKENNLIGLIHIGRDISDRKLAEEEIRQAKYNLEKRVEERTVELKTAIKTLREESHERELAVEASRRSESKYKSLSKEFNALLNGIPDNLILLSPDLQIMWSNKASENFFQKNGEKLSGQYCYSLCCKNDSPCQHCPTLVSFSSGKEESAEITTSGGKVWDIRAFPIKDEQGDVKNVIELARDVTEKVNLQASATRTRHLASLGELAAGVAHEINNPITNVINYAQLLIDEFSRENRDIEIPQRIIKDGDRIATIVRSLLSFARIRKEEKTVMYLHEVFSDTLSLTSAQIRKDGINLRVNIPSKFLRVPVHQQQIQQVFLNIISNARYALNQKYPGTHDDKVLEISCKEADLAGTPYVRIVFLDHGTGIPEDVLDKVVNPFFSTKPNHVGTGLGLSISHGILSEHDGKLLINSVEGEFTKITIDLPVIPDNEL
ncbi:MAG: PAS domain-containing protein [Nitrospiraceae bacterium]|nr:MAG: PAS domain-containing protein [Nitrospiraceae bacterium]